MPFIKNKQIIITNNFDINNKRLINVAAPLNENDAINKSYFDSKVPKNNYSAIVNPTNNDDINLGYEIGSKWINTVNFTIFECVNNSSTTAQWIKSNFEVYSFALSDYTLNLTTGTKDNFLIPYNCKIVEVIVGVATPPTGSPLIFDILKNGTTSIFSTKPSIDVSEYSTLTSETPNVLNSNNVFIKGDTIDCKIDQIGATIPGKGAKMYLLLERR